MDECQKIELGADDLRKVITAIEGEVLPHTEGFFFGTSTANPKQFAEKYGVTFEEFEREKQREKEEDLSVLRRALEWLEAKEENILQWGAACTSW